MANTAYKNWEDAREKAIKMLGKKCSLPKEPALIGEAMLEFNQHGKEVHKARDALVQKCTDAQTLACKAQGAAGAYTKVH
ncbi:MAG: hypothetical protein KGI51_11220, partial [Rhodospirillales bacterium]|nr:hypothetical protein [Rhodospirillales bacterium]